MCQGTVLLPCPLYQFLQLKLPSVYTYRVYEDYPYLLAEMYAYSMAAAHEKLPHLQVDNYMVSNTDAGGEAWPHVDRLPHVCVPPDEEGHFYAGLPMTTVVHYCQGYRAGDLGWQKRRVPHDIFSCESPMLMDTPADLAAATYQIKDGKVGVYGFHKLSIVFIYLRQFYFCLPIYVFF